MSCPSSSRRNDLGLRLIALLFAAAAPGAISAQARTDASRNVDSIPLAQPRFLLDRADAHPAPERGSSDRFALQASARAEAPAPGPRFRSKALDAACTTSATIFANGFE